MRLPLFVQLFGYAGLIPFLLGPAWLTFAPESAPRVLDHVWITYAGLIAAFMSGTFWGFALPAAQGTQGKVGIALSVLLMLATAVAATLPFSQALAGLLLVYLLLLAADIWRERTLDTIDGYFRMRSSLTIGVLIAIVWRLSLAAPVLP